MGSQEVGGDLRAHDPEAGQSAQHMDTKAWPLSRSSASRRSMLRSMKRTIVSSGQ
jgi:hypothetical protein